MELTLDLEPSRDYEQVESWKWASCSGAARTPSTSEASPVLTSLSWRSDKPVPARARNNPHRSSNDATGRI